MKPFSKKELINEALIARKNAKAEFSKFQVGAALLTRSGKVYRGCNIESSSYGLTICAERNAIFNALSDGEEQIVSIAVVADTVNPVSPCGACRQIMVDYAENADVYLSNLAGEIKETTVKELLPYYFNRNDLNEK
jgi:cytidine deaminase